MLGSEEWEAMLPVFLPKALAMAVRICGDLPTAEDVVQEAIVKIVQARDSFRGQAKLETWMLQIVLNTSRDALRRRQRQAEVLDPVAGSDRPAGSDRDNRSSPAGSGSLRAERGGQLDMADPKWVDPAAAQRQCETRAQIRRSVQQLPARQREVVQLLIWQGLPAEQVAELLSTTVQNVYANYHAAKQQLKRSLPPDLNLDT